MPRAFLKAREPFSSYSHFIGAVLSGAGLFVLLVRLLFDSSVTGSLAAAAAVNRWFIRQNIKSCG